MTYNSFPFSFWLLYNSHAYCMMHSFRNNSFCTNFIDFVVTSDTAYVCIYACDVTYHFYSKPDHSQFWLEGRVK